MAQERRAPRFGPPRRWPPPPEPAALALGRPGWLLPWGRCGRPEPDGLWLDAGRDVFGRGLGGVRTNAAPSPSTSAGSSVIGTLSAFCSLRTAPATSEPTSDTTVPSAPARPVRPERWT